MANQCPGRRPAGEYDSVVILDKAEVAAYKAQLEAAGAACVHVVEMTVQELQQMFLDDYLHHMGRVN